MATAMIDVSDGLLADLGHLLTASRVGAEIEAAALPLSAAFRQALTQEPALLDLALAGGEDYELLFTVPPEREAELADLAGSVGVPVTPLGRITAPESGLRVFGRDGRPIRVGKAGYDHFGRGA
jgi:thiamine-monophosphate kinase